VTLYKFEAFDNDFPDAESFSTQFDLTWLHSGRTATWLLRHITDSEQSHASDSMNSGGLGRL
jgi:hypothetical protein